MNIPDDATRVVLAAVVPCADSHRMQTPGKKPWCVAWPHVQNGRCDGCLGDGTRVVITDVEVERSSHYDSYDDFLDECWMEVP